MITNERPGVYSSYEVTNSISGSSTGDIVAIVAIAEKGFDDGAVKVTTYEQAVTAFGSCVLAEMCSLALQNGASAVYGVAIDEGGSDTEDYAAAFATIATIEDISIELCDSQDADVHEAMQTAILGASENYKYRIGIVESLGTVTELCASALALNCERMLLISADAGTQSGYFAAALAGAIAATTDPAVPITGADLSGITVTERYVDEDINTLVRGGVTIFEQAGTGAYVLRAVSTYSQTAGVSDATWREITTIRIIDELIPSVRDALKLRFTRAKNTEQTRGAIRTQVIIELEDRISREIIDSYGDVTVTASEDEPTACEVSLEFAVTHGLSHIMLTAKITV